MNWKGSTEIRSVSKDSFKFNLFVNKTREFHTGANLVIIPKIYRKSNIFLSNNSTDHTHIHTYLSHFDLLNSCRQALRKGGGWFKYSCIVKRRTNEWETISK